MRIAYRVNGKTKQNAKEIALKLYRSNCRVSVRTKCDPFVYLNLLRSYGVFAQAKPIIEDRKLKGYQFKNVA
jgi:hypothetical protein